MEKLMKRIRHLGKVERGSVYLLLATVCVGIPLMVLLALFTREKALPFIFTDIGLAIICVLAFDVIRMQQRKLIRKVFIQTLCDAMEKFELEGSITVKCEHNLAEADKYKTRLYCKYGSYAKRTRSVSNRLQDVCIQINEVIPNTISVTYVEIDNNILRDEG